MLVQGIAQRLAHAHVVEGLYGVIQIEGLHDVAASLQDFQIGKGLDLVGVEADSHVHGAGTQAHHQGLGIFDDLEGHLVQMCRFAPVFVELLQHDLALDDAGNELVRAGAHDFAQGIDAFGNDGGGDMRKEFGVGLLQVDDDGRIVRGGDRGNVRYVAHQRFAGLQTCGSGQGPDDVGNGNVLAVMEFNALPKLKGVLIGAVVDGIAFRDGRHQFTVAVGLDEAFKNIEKDLAGSCRR